MKQLIQAARGMRDLLSPETDYFLSLQDLLLKWSNSYGFSYIRLPLVENEKVFTSSLGQNSDIIEKEMFYLKGKERGEKLVLRPELTAGIMRAYLQNGLHSLPQPIKLFQIGPAFRKERPQAGRFREHYQWDLEIIGSAEPINDAQIIQIIDSLFKKLKLKDYIFKINSIGCPACREHYKKKLKSYYQSLNRKLCLDCKRRLKTNSLRLLDCKNPICQPFKAKAPESLNYLCKFCQEHFKKVLEYLEEMEINYELDHTLVRGFDYYSRTIFEVFFQEQNFAIGGGGRYDYLSKALSAKEIGAVGAGIGIERLTSVLKMHQVKLSFFKKPNIFIVQISEEAKKAAIKIFELLRKNNIAVAENFAKSNLSDQLSLANKLGVKYALIIGHEELGNENVILRDMKTGAQENIYWSELIEKLKDKL